MALSSTGSLLIEVTISVDVVVEVLVEVVVEVEIGVVVVLVVDVPLLSSNNVTDVPVKIIGDGESSFFRL